MPDSFAEYIRRKYSGGAGAPGSSAQSAVPDAFSMYAYSVGGRDREGGGNWGSDSGYRGGGYGSAPGAPRGSGGGSGAGSSGYPSSGRGDAGGGSYVRAGDSFGGTSGGHDPTGVSRGIGSDYGAVREGGYRAADPGRASHIVRSGLGDYGGINAVRNERQISYPFQSNQPYSGFTTSPYNVLPGMDTSTGSPINPRKVQTTSITASDYGPAAGRDKPGRLSKEYAGAVPTSTTGTYSPQKGRAPAAGAYGTTYPGASTGMRSQQQAAQQTLFDAISRAEGTTKYGYNTLYGNEYRDLGSMTLNEVQKLQSGLLREKGASPVGMFQINKATLKDFAGRLGYDMNTTKFTPEVQQQMALAIARDTPSLKRWDGFRKHPNELKNAKGALKMITPGYVDPGTVALYRQQQPYSGGGPTGSGGYGSSSRSGGYGSSYGGGGYKGGTYGGAGGSSISQGVGGAYKNR